MCTSLLTFDADGKAYLGRGIEYSRLMPTQISYLPAGTTVESATPDGKQGKTFSTQYPILAFVGQSIPSAKFPAVFQGTNDQGLSFGAQTLINSSSPTVGNDPSKILSVNDLGAWILGSFKSVSEVKAALLSGETEFWLPLVPDFGNTPYQEHYAVFDKNGGAIVIEFFNNKLNVYDNPVYVMTNQPQFPWHLENLNNYTFTNLDQNTGQLGKMKLVSTDAGIALAGLPSSQTSVGRFVKAAFYANYVRKATNPDDAITTLAHIMNNFDRPYDLTVDGAGSVGDGPGGDSQSTEVSYVLFLHDLSRNLFYVRSINAMNWSVIDINKLKDVKEIKSINSYDVNQAGADAFTKFYQ
jgi:penicillin V acylase-like amidase (Ntn superfamily)